MVRAARAVVPSLGRAWVEVGQSQGGQGAIFTAMTATKRAPELHYLGAGATVPARRKPYSPTWSAPP